MPDPQSSMLATFLAEADHPCPQCQYNLRNLRGTRCPECGEELVLRVNMAEPRQRLLIAGLIGLSAGAGLNGLLLIYAGIESFQRYSGVPRDFWIINTSELAVVAAAMFVWLRAWRWIRQRSISQRWIMMLACWALSLADILVFTFNIR